MNYHRLLAAYDGSEVSEKALKQAVQYVDNNPGSRLTVAHVLYRPAFSPEGLGWSTPYDYREKLNEYEESLIKRAETMISNLPYAEVVVLSGHPATAILEAATDKNCDLILMGSRGLGPVKEFVLGSVSHHVVQHSRVPVLIVK